MTDEPSGSRLAAELKDLRARLAEAEEVLRAIRSGEVDALLVTGERGEQIYTLTEKGLHEQIVAAERLARLILEQAVEAIIVCDEQGRVIRASQAAQRFCAGSPLLQPFAEVFPLRRDASDPFHLAPVFQGETLQNVDVVLDRHGQNFDLILNAGPLLSGQQVLGCVVTLTNITGRQRAEERILKQATLLDAANDAIYVRALDHTVNYWNQGAERLYGWTGAEALGRKITELPGLDVPAFEIAHAALLEQGAWTGELTMASKAGPPLVLLCRWTLLRDAHGGPEEVLAINTDLTEHKKLESQLRQAQKMEAIGQLAGGVAHDFNNMLFVMNGRAGMAMNGLKADDPLRTQLQLIHETGERAANLTRQLLAFSRRQTLQPKILNLNSVVTDMSKMLFRLIREDITMKMVLCPALRPTKADPGQVEQVLMNLIVNARDAMPGNGTVTIETANVELDEAYCRTHADASPGHYVMLAVSDTGCGMDDLVKARIFEPFFTTKEQGKGTGLGLATVYGIVKQSNGHIAVYSEVGKGTTFKIYLPETAAALARDSQVIVAVVPRGTETILLVEDEEDVRILTAEILESVGYKVLLAGDGVEALAAFDRCKDTIGLIITDVVMPKMNGPEMAKQARGLRPGIKVLFISGYTAGAVSSNGLLPLGTNYLQKPCTPGTLARKVREVLDCAAGTAAAGKR